VGPRSCFPHVCPTTHPSRSSRTHAQVGCHSSLLREAVGSCLHATRKSVGHILLSLCVGHSQEGLMHLYSVQTIYLYILCCASSWIFAPIPACFHLGSIQPGRLQSLGLISPDGMSVRIAIHDAHPVSVTEHWRESRRKLPGVLFLWDIQHESAEVCADTGCMTRTVWILNTIN
jgi:hypothetical protein